MLSVYIEASQPPAVHPRGTVSATVQVDGGSWSFNYSAISTPNNTAFALLLEASKRLGFELKWSRFVLPEGVFVTSIHGTANGQGGYWQYWVDGQYGDRAADRREIFSGDVVLWKLDVDRGGT